MKTRIVLPSSIALALVVFAGLGLRASAGQRGVTLRAKLSGLQEVPPISSPATAKLYASLDEDKQTITFRVNYRNLTKSPTVAHVHFGPTKVNGGVMFFFCGEGGKPPCPPTTSGTITATVTPADIVGPAAQGIDPGDDDKFAKVVRAIKTGNAYANIHNERFPTGEIRGQISSSDHDDGDD